MNDPEYDLQHRSDSPIYDKGVEVEPPFVWIDQTRHYQRTLVKEMIAKAESRINWWQLCKTTYSSLSAKRISELKKTKERLELYYEYLRFKS